jgi:hypothetical protein
MHLPWRHSLLRALCVPASVIQGQEVQALQNEVRRQSRLAEQAAQAVGLPSRAMLEVHEGEGRVVGYASCAGTANTWLLQHLQYGSVGFHQRSWFYANHRSCMS